MPYIRLARLKFELTDQDSAGWKNLSVLKVNRKGTEIGKVFSLDMALNIYETISNRKR